MKATRHEMYKSIFRLETPEASEGRGGQEYVEFEAQNAREHARNKTCEVQEYVRYLRHENTMARGT